ncbi:uncharacterized protein LOC120157232 [Hibiscus syriacus]|uniref:uncharacterized protein LOC120157232 n=1 Tax=Hibiscus syriacus TaxID=106335 RepID=UPI001921C632|nr:uncharacterized protein LOC120157232 [Hibiscus syriacus]
MVNNSWIWDKVRDKKPKVLWHRVVWFPLHIPKHSIVDWMIILDRMPTKDKLARLGMATDGIYNLCGIHIETRNHLFMEFMECHFSCAVWNQVLQLCCLRSRQFDWDNAMCWVVEKLKVGGSF